MESTNTYKLLTFTATTTLILSSIPFSVFAATHSEHPDQAQNVTVTQTVNTTESSSKSVLGASTENKGGTLPWTGDFLSRLGMLLTIAGACALFVSRVPYIKRKALEIAYRKRQNSFYLHSFLL